MDEFVYHGCVCVLQRVLCDVSRCYAETVW